MCSFGTALLKKNVIEELDAPPANCSAFIQNPSNTNEWLFFHSSHNPAYDPSPVPTGTINDTYSYNHITNKFKQLKFDTCPKNDGLMLTEHNGMIVCKGFKPNTVIVMSPNAIQLDDEKTYHFYNIFNTKKLKWQKKNDGKKYLTNLKSNSKNCRLVNSWNDNPFDHLIAYAQQLVVFKNFIIVSGARAAKENFQDIMTVYELDINTQQPKCIKTMKLKRKYRKHKMIQISQSEKSKNKFKVKLLLFGGLAEDGKNLFLDSFCVVDVIFTKSEYHQSVDVSHKMYQISSKWIENNVFKYNIKLNTNEEKAKLQQFKFLPQIVVWF